MSNLEYRYETFIAAPPEKVWEALTTAEFTEQYWHSTRASSTWKKGDVVHFMVDDANGDERIGCEGVVLKSDYPRELSYTWSFPNAPDPEVAAEPPSRLRLLLESMAEGKATRLRVIHDQFIEGSKMYEMISGGWPHVLAGLKTLLETGRRFDFSEYM